jgi:hypothetical protein
MLDRCGIVSITLLIGYGINGTAGLSVQGVRGGGKRERDLREYV